MRRAGQATIERRRVAGRAPTSPTVRARQLLLHAARDQAGQRVGALAARGDGEELAARYRHHVADLLVFQPIPQPRLPVHLMAATQPDGAPAVTARSSMSRARAGGPRRHLINDPGRRHRSRSAVHFSGRYSSRSISASPPGSPSSPWTSANPRPPCAITWPWPPGTRRPRHHQDLPERERRILPTHVQTAWPANTRPGYLTPAVTLLPQVP